MFALLMSRVKEDGQITGLAPHLVDGGISILQYADDTILFMEHNLKESTNIKLLLYAFEKYKTITICHKSKLFCYGQAKEMED
jgi:hypothetical protein